MDEDIPPDPLARLAERLDQIERLLQEQSARLTRVERQLNLDAERIAPHGFDTVAPANSPRTGDRGETPGNFIPPAPPPVHERGTDAPPSANVSDAASPLNIPPEGWRPSGEQARSATGGAHNPAGVPSVEYGQQRAGGERRPRNEGQRAGRASQAQAAATTGARGFDLETRIGGSWFNWIGIIAVTFGVAFFLKYAFENEWIGPAGRVMLGAAIGTGILLTGDRLRARGLRQYAFVLSGGGILILYLSVYAAFAFYHLIGHIPAFLLMIGVTATAVLLSARYNAQPIAILGLIGGFLTPMLLSTGRDNEAGLFSYIALLDAGVLALAYFKRWRGLNYMSFVATLLVIIGWHLAWYTPEKLWTTLFFLTLFFLLFSLLAILHNVFRQRPASWADVSLILMNATFYFGMSYAILNDAGYGPVLGAFAVVVSAFYLLLSYTSYAHHRADRLLRFSYVGTAITFFTMAVAIQLDQHWVTVGWAVEGVVLTWVGLRSDEDAPRLATLGVFSVAVIHWFGWDLQQVSLEVGSNFTPLFNRRAFSCAALIGSLAGAIWLYRRHREGVGEEERSVLTSLLMLMGNVLALTLLTLDANDYFTQRRLQLAQQSVTGEVIERLENSRMFAFSVVWSLYGAAALAIGVLRRLLLLRLVAFALLFIAAFKVLLIDATYYDATWHVLFFNQTFAAFMLLVATLGCTAWVYAHPGASHVGATERAVALSVLTVGANLLAVVALSLEASGYFEVRMAALQDTGELQDLRLAQQLSLSIIWTIYGAAMLLAGVLRKNRLLRLTGLLLLGLTTLKVFFWDLALLDRIYRIISFVLLGAILLIISYFYQQRQQRITEAEEQG